jgi:hypothetical protein
MYDIRKREIAGEIVLNIPPRISKLIKDGTVTSHVYISNDGVDVWYRFTEPGKTVNSFTGAQLLDELGSNSSGGVPYDLDEPTDDEADASPQGSVRSWNRRVKRETSSSLDLTRVPQTKNDAALIVRDRGLACYRKDGVLNFLPEESLTARDFTRTASSLIARAFLVANKRGAGRLWGIIGNQVESYNAPNLKSWWSLASPAEKLRVLSSTKTVKVSSIPEVDLLKLNQMVYPF